MDVTIARADTSATLTISGEMDASTAYDAYRAAISEAEQGFTEITLDLQQVTFIDSVGLGMLTRLRDELPRVYESALALRNPAPQVRRLLELTALASEFTVLD